MWFHGVTYSVGLEQEWDGKIIRMLFYASLNETLIIESPTLLCISFSVYNFIELGIWIIDAY